MAANGSRCWRREKHILFQVFTETYCHSKSESAKILEASAIPPAERKNTKPQEVQRMNIRPLYDRIVVKRIEEQETKVGGLFIPDSAKEKPQEGEVVAVGKGKRLEDGKVVPLDVQAGDRILFGKYSGSEIRLDGEEYLIMREDEVLGIVDKAAKTAKVA
jgi:chaperonin GroES